MSSLKSEETTQRRRMSAPDSLTNSSGATALPADLCIARPCASRVQPCVTTARYGARPRAATPTIRLELNQPRNWSPPSRYTSAGQRSPSYFSLSSTPTDDAPLSNQTSRMSVSFVNSLLPHFGQVNPSGRSSDAARAYQASPDSRSKMSATWLMVARSATPSPQAEQ